MNAIEIPAKDTSQKFITIIDAQLNQFLINSLRNNLAQQMANVEALQAEVAELTAKLNSLSPAPDSK